MTRALALALAVLAAALVGLALAEEARAATVDVTIAGSRFTPSTTEVRVGDVVRWNNNDAISHSARSSGNWDTGTIGPNGGSATVTMGTAGTFSYQCAFHAGMTGTVRVLAAAENTPPAVAVSAPVAGSTVSGNLNVVVIASDAENDPLTVTLKLDNGEYRALASSSAGWATSLDTRTLSQGPHTLTPRASDGRTTITGGTVTFVVNNPPTITLGAPEEGATFTIGRIVGVTGTTSAPANTTVHVEVSIDDGPWQNASGRTYWSYAWNTSGLGPGGHTVQARVRDALNTILSPVRIVELVEPAPDNPPELLVVSPAEGETVAGLVNITGNVSDADGSTPVVEVSIDGVEWRAVTGRAGARWWFHWLPRDDVSGATTIGVRATSDDATVTIARRVVLAPTPEDIRVELAGAAREASPVVLRVLAADGSGEPLPLARVAIFAKDGTQVGEAQTNASGYAMVPAIAAGSYEARAFAPGASARIPLEVRPLYEVTLEPRAVDFDRQVPLVVGVRAEKPLRNVPVWLEGAPLPGGRSDTVRTDRSGNASISLQALTSGSLRLVVGGNATDIVVEVVPTVLVTWSESAPRPNEAVRATFTLNDAARSPIAFQDLQVDVPGDGRQSVRTDATGSFTLRPEASGTLRVTIPREGWPSVVHAIAVRPGLPEAELSGLVARPGAASLVVAVDVKNVGVNPTTFTIDALASNGASAVQESADTRELAPGGSERVTMTLRMGTGEYDLLVTARNSTAAARGSATVIDAGVPPVLSPSTQAPVLPASIQEEEAEKKEAPGATLGALVALLLVAVVRRRDR